MTQQPTKMECSRPPFHPRKNTHQGFIGIQTLHHKKATLEVHKETELH